MDSIVKAILDKFSSRSDIGRKKYGTDLDRTDLMDDEWLRHLQEEMMDAILYIEKYIKQKNDASI